MRVLEEIGIDFREDEALATGREAGADGRRRSASASRASC